MQRMSSPSDSRLSTSQYLEKLVADCKNAKPSTITSDNWDVDSEALLRVFRQAPFPQTHFGCIIASLEEYQRQCSEASASQSRHSLFPFLALFDASEILRDVMHAHYKTAVCLTTLAGRSQTDSTSTSVSSLKKRSAQEDLGASRSATRAKRSSDVSILQRDMRKLPCFIGGDTLDGVKYGGLPWLHGNDGPKIDSLDTLQEELKNTVKQFSSQLATYFESASVLGREPSIKSMKEDQDAMKEEEGAAGAQVRKESNDEKPDAKSKTIRKEDIDLFRKSLIELEQFLISDEDLPESGSCQRLVPGLIGHEIDVVQPFLFTLLQSFACRIEQVGSEQYDKQTKSPWKTVIQSNRIISKTQNRPERVADQSITPSSRVNFCLRDDLAEIMVEIKPPERRDESPLSLNVECNNQLQGSLAKHVGVGFNFKCFGSNTRATGIILTTFYVQIVQLRLEDVGTENVQLSVLHTPCLPLLPKTIFDDQIDSSKSKKEWKQLVGYSSDDDNVPRGLIALANLMTTHRSAIFGPVPFQSAVLADMIGFGAFSTIHAVKQEPNQVIKVSRYGADTILQHEAEVLRNLQKTPDDSSSHPNIVDFIGYGVERLTLCEQEIELQALRLGPRGIKIQSRILGGDREVHLKQAANDISAALLYMHERGYIHFDLAPKNILFANNRFFLIDFGCAQKKDKAIYGVLGTARYAHRDIVSRYPNLSVKRGDCRKDYDFAALAFTLAALSPGGSLLWKPREPSAYSQQWADDRSEKSWMALETLNFPSDPWKTRCFDGDVSE